MRLGLTLFSRGNRPLCILSSCTKRPALWCGLLIGIAVVVSVRSCFAQSTTLGVHTPDSQSNTSDQGAQPPAMGGSNTGARHPAVLDGEHRPITAGGFTKMGPALFKDIARQAGLTTWEHVEGTPEKRFIIETNGSGVGLLDYDNDGWLDIYLVNGSTYDAMSGKTAPPKAALFHNNHGGTFTDVAEKAGVTLGNWSTGGTWGDYDGDGRLDHGRLHQQWSDRYLQHHIF
jgi:enediyne biosynthesis protein E4